jgi:hypothetical protein
MTNTMTSQNIDLSSWNTLYIRRYGDGEKLDAEILADLHAFNNREFKQVGLAMPPDQLLEEFCSYAVFKSSLFLDRCLVNMTVLAPKIECLQISPKSQNGNFLENGSYDYDRISVIYGGHLPK